MSPRNVAARPAIPAVIALSLLAACTAVGYRDAADAEVEALLETATERAIVDHQDGLLQPVVEPAAPAEAPLQAVAPSPSEQPAGLASDLAGAGEQVGASQVAEAPLDLAGVLSLAVRQNREYLTRRETLYRSGLSISLTRFQFGPQFRSAVSYLWPRAEGGFESQQASTVFSGSQLLPTGGTLAVSAGLDADWPNDSGVVDVHSVGARAGVSLTQPLLRGAGYAVSHEPLKLAERQFVYAVRDFELYRQGFTIDVARRFFELISERKQLANQDANYEAAVFDRGKAQALAQVGRVPEQDVFLARRRAIVAKDSLINARAAFERSVDSFKILLGIPTTTPLEFADIEPPYDPIRFEVSSAIAAALHNRLDLITQRQSVQDTERALRIARNALLPDLDLTVSYGVGGAGGDLEHALPDQWDASVGLSFELPLQRKPQRNSYRSALISLEQARRALDLREDQLALEIRNAVRQLRSIEERVELQEQQIRQELRVVTITKIRYESGRVDNRILLEARQAYVDAQNALIDLKVQHFVARLSLLRDMGLLFVDADGMWREGVVR